MQLVKFTVPRSQVVSKYLLASRGLFRKSLYSSTPWLASMMSPTGS